MFFPTFTPLKTNMTMENRPSEDVSPTKMCDFPLPCSWKPGWVMFKFQPQQINPEQGPTCFVHVATSAGLQAILDTLSPIPGQNGDCRGSWKWRSSKSSTNGPLIIELEHLRVMLSPNKKHGVSDQSVIGLVKVHVYPDIRKTLDSIHKIPQVREPNHLRPLIPASLHQSSHHKHWKLQFEQHFELDIIT